MWRSSHRREVTEGDEGIDKRGGEEELKGIGGGVEPIPRKLLTTEVRRKG